MLNVIFPFGFSERSQKAQTEKMMHSSSVLLEPSSPKDANIIKVNSIFDHIKTPGDKTTHIDLDRFRSIKKIIINGVG